MNIESVYPNTKAIIIFNIQLYVCYESTKMLTFIRQAGRLNFIVLEDLGTDSKVKDSTSHIQLNYTWDP